MGKRIVKNYPSPRLVQTIGATNQTAADAIGELVANCFDARFEEEKLEIFVELHDDEIRVIDNGKGMTDEVLEHAVCIGEDMSRYIERGEGAKGHFGMGFKTSCATLGEYYEIATRPANGSIEYHVAFDIGDYANRPTGADAWDIEIRDTPFDAQGPLSDRPHGTAFVIRDLRDKNIPAGAVFDYLGNAFKGHLVTGDHITVVDRNGTSYQAVPKVAECIPGTKVAIDTTCGPNDAYRITGWMALDKQTHNDGNYGFNIYRKNQLVKRWDKSWIRKHLMTSRIIGEVNMDFLDATFYKQGLQESEVWNIVKAHMTEYLKGIQSASQKLSKQGNVNKPEMVQRVVSDLRVEYAHEEPIPDPVTVTGSDTGKGSDKPNTSPAKPEKIPPIIREDSLTLEDGSLIRVLYREDSSSISPDAPFDYIFDMGDEGETSELMSVVFLNHPLWLGANAKVMRMAKVLATSDAIYRALVEKLAYKPANAQNVRNEWVRRRVAVNAEGQR